MDLFFAFLLILGFVLAPGALVFVDRRMVRGWARTFAMVAIFFSGIASIWAVKSQEVRGVAYQFRLEMGNTLAAIHLALDQDRGQQVQTVLKQHSPDGIHHAPSWAEIRSITEGLSPAAPGASSNPIQPVPPSTGLKPMPARSNP